MLAAGSALAAGLALVYGWWIAHPPSAALPVADAVLVHAGERGRARLGLELMEERQAPTLVLMFGTESRWTRQLCGQTEPFEVLCPDADPVSTLGEARELAELASERGWTTVIAVTSNYHLRRAVHLDAKCSGVTVIGSASITSGSVPVRFRRVFEEMVSYPLAAITSC